MERRQIRIKANAFHSQVKKTKASLEWNITDNEQTYFKCFYNVYTTVNSSIHYWPGSNSFHKILLKLPKHTDPPLTCIIREQKLVWGNDGAKARYNTCKEELRGESVEESSQLHSSVSGSSVQWWTSAVQCLFSPEIRVQSHSCFYRLQTSRPQPQEFGN